MICLYAAFADGDKQDAEREELKRLANSLLGEDDHASSYYQKVLLRQISLEELTAGLAEKQTRQLAYEMAVCVCEADGKLSDLEKQFLGELQARLAVSASSASEFVALAESTHEQVLVPAQESLADNPASVVGEKMDRMILNYAILNAALELLPETLATVAIIPMQTKMVYRIGREYGVELNAGQVKELAAAVGLGFTSQVVEGFARKFLKGLLRKSVGGKWVRKSADQLASSAFSFASTFALGHLAKTYYSGGRKLSSDQLKNRFQQYSEQAQGLHQQWLPQIQEKAASLDLPKLLNMVRGSADPV